jgi:hypothetical protein
MQSDPGSADEIPATEVIPICLIVVLTVLGNVLERMYWRAGREYPEVLYGLLPLAAACSAWAWLYSYAARYKVALPIDTGWLVVGAWWIVVPYYLIRVRGRRAAWPILSFVALWLVSDFIGAAVIPTIDE